METINNLIVGDIMIMMMDIIQIAEITIQEDIIEEIIKDLYISGHTEMAIALNIILAMVTYIFSILIHPLVLHLIEHLIIEITFSYIYVY